MKKINWKKWGILAAAALVVAFFAAKVADIIKGECDTVFAEISTVYDTVEAEAFITREETLLYNANGGTMVALADNAEKVAADSTVAGMFTSAKAADSYVQLQYLKEELAGYERISNQRALENLDVEMLRKQVDTDFQNIADTVYAGCYSDISDLKLTFLVDISRRQISLEEEIDCSAVMQSLREQIASLEQVAVPTGTVKAGQTGYYMAEADGYESTLPVSALPALSVAGAQALLKAEPETVADNCIGKIVNGFCWYMVAVTDADSISGLESGDKQTVIIGNADSDTVETEVASVVRQSDGKGALVLRCNEMTSDSLAMRKATVKLVRKKYTGLKVPKEALRKVKAEVETTDENGKTTTAVKAYDCVYVRLGNVTRMRYLNIVYASDTYVIAADDGSLGGSKIHLKNHDSIIINAKGMKG